METVIIFAIAACIALIIKYFGKKSSSITTNTKTVVEATQVVLSTNKSIEVCSKCGHSVARYVPQPNGSIICANCANGNL